MIYLDYAGTQTHTKTAARQGRTSQPGCLSHETSSFMAKRVESQPALGAFTSGGVVQGTIQPTLPHNKPAGPARPPGIPKHYVFDEEVELWMPPSAISKASVVTSGNSSNAFAGSGITVIKSGESNPAPYAASKDDPICFEFTNTGTCSRIVRGQICRYRHLEAHHPDVLADKVRQGKLPPSALLPDGGE